MRFRMQPMSHRCHSIFCRPPFVRIRPGNILWWILGIVREVFALPRRLSVLQGWHTVSGSGGHCPPSCHGLHSGVLYAPGLHQHGGCLPLSSQQGKYVYSPSSHLERLCTLFCFYSARVTWAKEKLELDFSLGRFTGLKGKYCFSKCHSLFVLSYFFSQPYFSEDQSIWSYTYWSDTFRSCTSLLPCKYQDFISTTLSKWKRNINFPSHPMSLFNMKWVNTILLW